MGAQPSPDDPDAARIVALAGRLDAARVQVMYQVAILGRRDLPLAPDEIAGFGMAVMRMHTFGTASPGESLPARSAQAVPADSSDTGPAASVAVAREPPPAISAVEDLAP